jgi:putative phosphoesterase
MRIGIISDTHGLLRPEAIGVLQGCDHILHAGDVGSEELLTALRLIAPVTAIRGNVDATGKCSYLPAAEAVELGGKLFYMIHSIQDLDIDARSAKVDVVVSGHSHVPSLEIRDGVLYLNPGSAGRRRFRLPVSLALVEIDDGILSARLVQLSPDL